MANEAKSGSQYEKGGSQPASQSGSQYQQGGKSNQEQGKDQHSDRGGQHSGQSSQERSGAGDFKCEVCGQSFNSEDERREHHRSRHEETGKAAGQSGR